MLPVHPGFHLMQREAMIVRDRNALLRRIRANYQLYLFLLLPAACVVLFHYVPMGGIVLAFKQYNIRKGIWGSPWVGFKYFNRFFGSYQFGRVIGNTLSVSFYSLFASFPIPILFALVLNAVPLPRFRKTVQTVTYMPHFISTVVMVGLLMQIFNPRMGLFGIVYKALFGEMAPDLFGKPAAFRHLYVWSGVWQSTGWASIIYFAALSSVDRGLHEAAQIDGASRFARVLHIDLPCILPTARIMLIMAAGRVMSVGFEKVFLMQNSLNLSASEVISTYVYKVGIVTGGGDFSFGTAVGLFNSVVNFALMMTVNFICRRLGGSSLW